MIHDLTRGRIASSLLLFALPMVVGNLLQQLYNIADTLIVGRVLGGDALAAATSFPPLPSAVFPPTYYIASHSSPP